eukprot:tig00000455_g1029.t1
MYRAPKDPREKKPAASDTGTGLRAVLQRRKARSRVRATASQLREALKEGSSLHAQGDVQGAVIAYKATAREALSDSESELSPTQREALEAGMRGANAAASDGEAAYKLQMALGKALEEAPAAEADAGAKSPREAAKDKGGNLVVEGELKFAAEPLPRSSQTPTVTGDAKELLEKAIDDGVPLFNSGNIQGCFEVYEAAAERVLGPPALPGFDPALVAYLRNSLRKAQMQPPREAAWTLRRAFDRLLDEAEPYNSARLGAAPSPRTLESAVNRAFEPEAPPPGPKRDPWGGPPPRRSWQETPAGAAAGVRRPRLGRRLGRGPRGRPEGPDGGRGHMYVGVVGGGGGGGGGFERGGGGFQRGGGGGFEFERDGYRDGDGWGGGGGGFERGGYRDGDGRGGYGYGADRYGPGGRAESPGGAGPGRPAAAPVAAAAAARVLAAARDPASGVPQNYAFLLQNAVALAARQAAADGAWTLRDAFDQILLRGASAAPGRS